MLSKDHSKILLIKAVNDLSIILPTSVTAEEFGEFMWIDVSKNINNNRHKTQTLMRKHFTGTFLFVGMYSCFFCLSSLTFFFFLDDKKKGIVPDSFPCLLDIGELIKTNFQNDTQTILLSSYRTCCSDDFYYFVTRMLSSVNASETNFESKKPICCSVKFLLYLMRPTLW